MPARIVIHSRPGCHLCDDAYAVCAPIAAQRGADLEVRSILDDPGRWPLIANMIPVIEVDGAVVATWRITAEQLRAALDPPTR
jgi:hypothetical protein